MPLQRNTAETNCKDVSPITEVDKEETFEEESKSVKRVLTELNKHTKSSGKPKFEIASANFMKTYKADEIVNELASKLIGSIKTEFQKEKSKLSKPLKKKDNKENVHRNVFESQISLPVKQRQPKTAVKQKKQIKINKPKGLKISDFIKIEVCETEGQLLFQEKQKVTTLAGVLIDSEQTHF